MKSDKYSKRARRKLSIRAKIVGTQERPRMSVFRSNMNVYAQIIDDTKGITICSCSSVDKEIAAKGKCNKTIAVKVGELLSKRAKEKGIKSLVFDRNGYKYHGVIKEIAESCRKAGIEF